MASRETAVDRRLPEHGGRCGNESGTAASRRSHCQGLGALPPADCLLPDHRHAHAGHPVPSPLPPAPARAAGGRAGAHAGPRLGWISAGHRRHLGLTGSCPGGSCRSPRATSPGSGSTTRCPRRRRGPLARHTAAESGGRTAGRHQDAVQPEARLQCMRSRRRTLGPTSSIRMSAYRSTGDSLCPAHRRGPARAAHL